jgi:hypothetical protein
MSQELKANGLGAPVVDETIGAFVHKPITPGTLNDMVKSMKAGEVAETGPVVSGPEEAKRPYRKAEALEMSVAITNYKGKLNEIAKLVADTLSDDAKPISSRANRLQYAMSLCNELGMAIKDLKVSLKKHRK